MKKIVRVFLTLCCLFFTSSFALANADKITIPEGANLKNINRIAIGAPLYLQVKDTAPSLEILTQVLYDAGRATKANVVSYDAVVSSIAADKKVDLTTLNRREAAKVFKDNVVNYADTYVVLTVANNSRTTFFFDVFRAGSNELIYSYEIRANRDEDDTVATFNSLSEKFFKRLVNAIEDQRKK